MGRPVPPVDLSTGTYDELETSLSETLGIKVLLVRDWTIPDDYNNAEANISFARTQEEQDKARAEFAKVEEATLASLRANIADRDPELGASLGNNSLRSLLEVYHTTYHEGEPGHEGSVNDPERAVILFDPADNTRGDPVLDFALISSFKNAWCDTSKARQASHDGTEYDVAGKIPVKDLTENFQMDPDDVRRYQAIQHVKYALSHQDEYNHLGRAWYYEPLFYKFSRIEGEDVGEIWENDSQKPYEQVRDERSFDASAEPGSWGFKDPEFFKKLKLTGAIRDLTCNILTPNTTFARLDCRYSVTGQQVYDIGNNLHNRLQEQTEKHVPENVNTFMWTIDAMSDWRILFPVFREVYEKDTSTGPEREYLDTIWKGLQTYFPTITNGPVPELKEGCEPPQKRPAAGTKTPKTAAPAQTPKPTP